MRWGFCGKSESWVHLTHFRCSCWVERDFSHCPPINITCHHFCHPQILRMLMKPRHHPRTSHPILLQNLRFSPFSNPFWGCFAFFSGACQVTRSKKPLKVKEAAFRASPRRSPGEKKTLWQYFEMLPKKCQKRADLAKDLTSPPAPKEVMESLKWIYQLWWV